MTHLNLFPFSPFPLELAGSCASVLMSFGEQGHIAVQVRSLLRGSTIMKAI